MTLSSPEGVLAPDHNPLVEESILPTALNQRPIGAWGYAFIWVGIAVIIATYSLGATGVQGGIGLSEVILTIFVANLILGAFMLLTADIGTEHGLSFAVYLRAPFGIHGTHLPSLSRGLVAAMWFGIQTYLGAIALNGIGEYFLGFDNWFVWYVLFAIVQVVNTASGIQAVEKLAALAAPAIIAISVWMYFTLDGIADTKGLNIWNLSPTGDMSLLVLFVANLGFWSTMAIDIPNLTRFVRTESGARGFLKRNRSVFAGQLIALPITQALIAGIGGVSWIATGNWNPIEVIQADAHGLALIALLALVVLAQWSTNTAANLIPAALTFVNAAPRYIDYRIGVALAGIVGTVCFPWAILDNLFVFLGYYGAFLSAIAGIMIADYYLIRRRRLNVPDLYRMDGQFRYAGGFNADYYLIRRRRLNVPDLYRMDGQFRYAGGFNWAGLIAWLVAGGLAAWWSQYAVLIGFPVGLLLYIVLTRAVVLPKYAQAEIESGFSDRFLATSRGESWADIAGSHRKKREDL